MWNDCHIARNSCTGTAARNSCAGTAAHHPPQRPAGCMLSALSAFPRLWLVLLGTSHGLLAAGLSAWPGRPVGAKSRLEDLFREGWLSQPRRMLQRPGVPGGQGRRQRLSVAHRFRHNDLVRGNGNGLLRSHPCQMEPPDGTTTSSHSRDPLRLCSPIHLSSGVHTPEPI